MPFAPLSLKLAGLYGRLSPTQRGGLRIAKLARRAVPREQWRSCFETPTGLTLDLDLATYPDICMAAGVYETDTLRAIRRLLWPGDHFVDVGANLGYFTLLAAKCVGQNGRVDAFEPDPLNRDRLLRNVAANDLASIVTVHAVAAGEANGTITLHHPAAGRGNHGQASTVASLAPDGETFEVPLDRVDARVPRVPSLVKMDVEGAELHALRGMSTWFAGPKPPRLIIEHNPVTSRAAGFSGGDLFRLLRELLPECRVRWIGFTSREFATPESLDRCDREGNLLVTPATP